jgi:hypothetical protein
LRWFVLSFGLGARVIRRKWPKEGKIRLKEEQLMAKNEKRTARKPATKFPNLRKKLQKSKIQSKQVKKR